MARAARGVTVRDAGACRRRRPPRHRGRRSRLPRPCCVEPARPARRAARRRDPRGARLAHRRPRLSDRPADPRQPRRRLGPRGVRRRGGRTDGPRRRGPRAARAPRRGRRLLPRLRAAGRGWRAAGAGRTAMIGAPWRSSPGRTLVLAGSTWRHREGTVRSLAIACPRACSSPRDCCSASRSPATRRPGRCSSLEALVGLALPLFLVRGMRARAIALGAEVIVAVLTAGRAAGRAPALRAAADTI